jgi:hypothetical protein
VNTQKRFFQASKVCQTQTGGQIRAFVWDWHRLTIICCWRTESVSLIHFVGNQNYNLYMYNHVKKCQSCFGLKPIHCWEPFGAN